jgi:phosphoglycerate dehydrogenase-like enzyme
LTTSSAVYADPCAQHLLGFLFAGSRRIGDAVAEQRGERRWVAKELRRRSSVLTGQALLMFGYGAIGRRLTQLLAPLEMRLGAVRRAPSGDEPIRVLREAESADALAVADHVVCILPGGTATARYFDRARFSAMKPGARFYNIGRGTTVDQDALLEALDAGTLDSAYLDVTDPEPLPAEHPLWAHPRCIVTPHTAGGFEQEYEALADHFLTNFRRYIDREPLHDRVL